MTARDIRQAAEDHADRAYDRARDEGRSRKEALREAQVAREEMLDQLLKEAST